MSYPSSISSALCPCGDSPVVSAFMDTDVWDLDFSRYPILTPLLQHLMRRTDKSAWDHVAGKSVSATLLLLCRSQWGSVFHLVRLTAFVLYVTRLFFDHVTYHMLFEVILYLYYWYFRSSWNQISSLHWKWMSMRVTVLSIPINHRHQNTTLFKFFMTFYQILLC